MHLISPFKRNSSVFCFLLSALLLHSPQPLHAQESGAAAQRAAQTAADDSWHNWAFASCAVVIVAVGILVVSTGQGKSSS